jgi:hypothetical protein
MPFFNLGIQYWMPVRRSLGEDGLDIGYSSVPGLLTYDLHISLNGCATRHV